MNTTKITFINKQGHSLSAKLNMPDGEPIAYALFAHCFTCNKNLTAVRNISAALNEANIAVLLFDFTGLGESGGEFENTNFSSNLDDLYSAAEFLADNYKAPALLIGHSLGGTAVISAANQLESVKAVATIGSPSGAGHVAGLFKSSVAKINDKGLAVVDLGGRNFTIKKQFLDDISTHHIKQHLLESEKALLIIHSPQDDTVGIENAAEIYKLAHHPKSFIALNGADHLLTKRKILNMPGKL